MSHDPLCHVAECRCGLVAACQCPLIERVKEREHERWNFMSEAEIRADATREAAGQVRECQDDAVWDSDAWHRLGEAANFIEATAGGSAQRRVKELVDERAALRAKVEVLPTTTFTTGRGEWDGEPVVRYADVIALFKKASE